jgi:hypothetical protein
MPRKTDLFTGLILGSFLAAGCGYSAGTLLPAHLKTVYIPPFKENFRAPAEDGRGREYELFYPGLSADVTREVIARFFSDGTLQVVDREDADSVLEGEVVGFRRNPLSYTDADEVREYRVTVVANVVFRDLKRGRIVWEEKGFTGEDTYLAGESEEASVKVAVRDLARRVVNGVMETW